MMHTHITSDGKVVGTLWLNEYGHVEHDGSKAAHNMVTHAAGHGVHIHHGQTLLDYLVKNLSHSTRVSAHHCDQQH